MRSPAPRAIILGLKNEAGATSGAERGAAIIDWEEPGRCLVMPGSFK